MTIGIGATGPNAGLAVWRALAVAERVAEGSIGGFAAFAAIGEAGTLLCAETQRGGSRTLFTEGETTGVAPPPEVATARYAAVISSGPDRPDPLAQFLAADPAVGLVTGHRLPNTKGSDGVALNQSVLSAMAGGLQAADALERVLSGNETADAGMIALGPDRGIAARNSALVATRPDLGAASQDDGHGAAVKILHNAISPTASLAPLLADIAMAVLAPVPVPAGHIIVNAGTPLVLGHAHRLLVDETDTALRIETSDPGILTGRHVCAAVYLGAVVHRAGSDVGRTIVEPNVLVENGHVVRMSGRSEFRIPYIALSPTRSRATG